MEDALQTAADEFEWAALHPRTAARHFCQQEVPRGRAPAPAALRHAANARAPIRQRAVFHTAKSTP